MATCEVCGKHIDLPYNCRRCGNAYCAEHRLPENHSCAGLDEWNDPAGVFESDRQAKRRTSRLNLETGPGGPLSYFRGNLAYTFLAIMVVTFLLEWISLLFFGRQTFSALFTLSSAHPEYLWTWITSVFAHSPFTFTHLFGNGLVMFFFGPFLEKRIGSKRFALLFLGGGIIAGLAQIGVGLVLGNSTAVLGASGGIMAMLAVLTVLNPDLKVYLYFVLPIPIWVLTGGYALLSIAGVLSTGNALGGNIAHAAHLMGLVVGFFYAYHIKDEVSAPSQFRLGGGGGGMGGPGRRF
ncbi:rhomboid family intramembrane serine protease [Natronomonas sp. EA1]|uniref:rhomboid family intramembrane serine protease n=1 Tax=Natronomonas sp. EA1 TaxID=3421655 RepID=UPI003EC118E1